MPIFEPFNLGHWKGKEYVIPAEEVMRCIAKVESVVTLFDLGEMRMTGKLRTMQLCQGLATAMRYAGAEVTDDELYNTIFVGSDANKIVLRAWTTLHALERLMIPPEHLREAEEKAGAAQGKRRRRGARAASSKPRTSSQSA